MSSVTSCNALKAFIAFGKPFIDITLVIPILIAAFRWFLSCNSFPPWEINIEIAINFLSLKDRVPLEYISAKAWSKIISQAFRILQLNPVWKSPKALGLS